jgi:hypothetical protein
MTLILRVANGEEEADQAGQTKPQRCERRGGAETRARRRFVMPDFLVTEFAP